MVLSFLGTKITDKRVIILFYNLVFNQNLTKMTSFLIFMYFLCEVILRFVKHGNLAFRTRKCLIFTGFTQLRKSEASRIQQNISLYASRCFVLCSMSSGEHVCSVLFVISQSKCEDLTKIDFRVSTKKDWSESQLRKWFVTFSFQICNLVKQKNIIFIMNIATKKIICRLNKIQQKLSCSNICQMLNDKSSGISLSFKIRHAS